MLPPYLRGQVTDKIKSFTRDFGVGKATSLAHCWANKYYMGCSYPEEVEAIIDNWGKPNEPRWRNRKPRYDPTSDNAPHYTWGMALGEDDLSNEEEMMSPLKGAEKQHPDRDETSPTPNGVDLMRLEMQAPDFASQSGLGTGTNRLCLYDEEKTAPPMRPTAHDVDNPRRQIAARSFPGHQPAVASPTPPPPPPIPDGGFDGPDLSAFGVSGSSNQAGTMFLLPSSKKKTASRRPPKKVKPRPPSKNEQDVSVEKPLGSEPIKFVSESPGNQVGQSQPPAQKQDPVSALYSLNNHFKEKLTFRTETESKDPLVQKTLVFHADRKIAEATGGSKRQRKKIAADLALKELAKSPELRPLVESARTRKKRPKSPTPPSGSSHRPPPKRQNSGPTSDIALLHMFADRTNPRRELEILKSKPKKNAKHKTVKIQIKLGGKLIGRGQSERGAVMEAKLRAAADAVGFLEKCSRESMELLHAIRTDTHPTFKPDEKKAIKKNMLPGDPLSMALRLENKGRDILLKLGWDPTKGLGKESRRNHPETFLQPVRTERHGLGYPVENQQDEDGLVAFEAGVRYRLTQFKENLELPCPRQTQLQFSMLFTVPERARIHAIAKSLGLGSRSINDENGGRAVFVYSPKLVTSGRL